MPELLTPTRMSIVVGLLQADDEGLRLSEVADLAGVSDPTAHKHLEFLIDQGLVESTADQPGRTHYLVRSFFRATWIEPDYGILASWASESIDWRFPLVTMIPDTAAQRIMTRFLEAAMFRGLFHPWSRTAEVPRPESAFERGMSDADRDTAADRGVTVVVYGSCARGDAGASSDVDVLVIQPSDQIPLDLTEEFEELAAEANLRAERRIEIKVIDRGGFSDLPETLQRHILKEGVPVYSTFRGGEFLEILEEDDVDEPR